MAYASDLAGGRRSAGRLRFFTLACIGFIAAVLTGQAVSQSSVLQYAAGSAVLRGLYVALFFGVGTFSWWRRPGGRLGPLLIGVGSVFALTSLNASADSAAFTLGMTFWAAYVVLLSFIYLSFPRGRLELRDERACIASFGIATVVFWVAILALAPELPPGAPFAICGDACPANAFQVVDAPSSLGRALNHGYELMSAGALIWIAALIIRKARSPEHLRRRAYGPLAVAFTGLIAGYLLYRAVTPRYPGTVEAFRVFLGIAALAGPVAILLGQIWGSVSVATSLGQMAMQVRAGPLSPRRMQSLIGEALGDPTLELALWRRERAGFVDVDDEPVGLPKDGWRGVTLVEREGAPVAALLHAPDLDIDPAVVEALAATSLLLLENTRLVEELRASRARIVDTAETERLRLERDLHDGAQQRLMAIQVKLSLARDEVADGDAARLLDEIGGDAAAAVEELRQLAHGIYPTILRERGLGDALRAAATTAPLPVTIEVAGVGRCAPTVEAALYFCCLEAIQNAAKHAGHGSQVSVTFRERDGVLDFEVADNGPGIQPSAKWSGMGFTSMRDRVGAVGGELEIVSSPGVGMTVHGSVPTGDPIRAG